MSFFCFHGSHEVCGDSYPLALYRHERLETWVCGCLCHQRLGEDVEMTDG
jgi:hypothetical protein